MSRAASALVLALLARAALCAEPQPTAQPQSAGEASSAEAASGPAAQPDDDDEAEAEFCPAPQFSYESLRDAGRKLLRMGRMAESVLCNRLAMKLHFAALSSVAESELRRAARHWRQVPDLTRLATEELNTQRRGDEGDEDESGKGEGEGEEENGWPLRRGRRGGEGEGGGSKSEREAWLAAMREWKLEFWPDESARQLSAVDYRRQLAALRREIEPQRFR